MKLLKIYALFFIVLLFGNTVFQIVFSPQAVSPVAWLVALRYAAATVSAALFLPSLVILLMQPVMVLRRGAFWLAGAILFCVATLLVADMLYYRQAGKHISAEFALMFGNGADISKMIFTGYKTAFTAVILSGVVFFYLWRRWLRHDVIRVRALWLRIAASIFFILLSIIAFRGGLQDRPMRPADAYQYLSQAEADFALNGAYTAFYAMYHSEDFPAHGDAETIRRARQLLGRNDERFINDELAFYRSSKLAAAPVKKNVVIFILESWSARRLGIFGDPVGATPFFDSIARKGWLVNNAFATGRRSIAALPSVVSGIPTLYGSLYITSPHEQNFQRGMGTIFAEQGYSTRFTYAAKAGSMGFNAFARLAGFEKILTRDDFPSDAPTDGVWGVYDHITFARIIADIDASVKPVLSVVYTLHPHPPFTLPPGNIFLKADQPRAAYYNALRYSDNTLRDFFSVAEKKSWFKDTVFVFVADHAFEEAQGLDSFHIPLLFYAPGFIAAKSDETVASQLDILPTLVDLLHFETAHAAMGKSLLAPGSHFAFIDPEHSGGIVRAQGGHLLALMFGVEKFRGYFNMKLDAGWRSEIAAPPFAATEMQSMRSYIDAMGYAVSKNRIAPRLR